MEDWTQPREARMGKKNKPWWSRMLTWHLCTSLAFWVTFLDHRFIKKKIYIKKKIDHVVRCLFKRKEKKTTNKIHFSLIVLSYTQKRNNFTIFLFQKCDVQEYLCCYWVKQFCSKSVTVCKGSVHSSFCKGKRRQCVLLNNPVYEYDRLTYSVCIWLCNDKSPSVWTIFKKYISFYVLEKWTWEWLFFFQFHCTWAWHEQCLFPKIQTEQGQVSQNKSHFL